MKNFLCNNFYRCLPQAIRHSNIHLFICLNENTFCWENWNPVICKYVSKLDLERIYKLNQY